MTVIEEETAARVSALRQEAVARLERAEALRLQAEDEEHAAWAAQAQAAILESSARRRNSPPRRRQPIHGDPTSSGNRLLALMEALGIDERVEFRDGLDMPLRVIEARLGICYARRGTPAVGTRIGICERALRPEAQTA